MRKNTIYLSKLPVILFVASILLITACSKKGSGGGGNTITDATPATLGMYKYSSGNVKILFLAIPKIGSVALTDTNSQYLDFDTGSAGLSIDAHGILPASMITDKGFVFTGDSVVSNGITIKKDTGTMQYGDKTDLTVVHGNQAYADVTLGDNGSSVTIKRIPIFLYYKATQSQNGKVTSTYSPHTFDIIGVSPGYSYFSTKMLSPFSYYDPGTGLTKGFKLAQLGSGFTSVGSYDANVLTVGLTSADLSSTGFVMHKLTFNSNEGYSPDIAATTVYGAKTVTGPVVFDTGTSPYTYIEDRTAIRKNISRLAALVRAKSDVARFHAGISSSNPSISNSISAVGALASGTKVTVTTNQNFVYSFTTSSRSYLTQIENPNTTGDPRTILAIDYFINNEYLLDYTGHQIGLKNN